jgi:hypothetical protein
LGLNSSSSPQLQRNHDSFLPHHAEFEAPFSLSCSADIPTSTRVVSKTMRPFAFSNDGKRQSNIFNLNLQCGLPNLES